MNLDPEKTFGFFGFASTTLERGEDREKET
jgi:hypothetical protein